MNLKLNFMALKPNVLKYFILIFLSSNIVYSQSSDSLQGNQNLPQLRLNFQNNELEKEFKIIDSWVYINDFGEIRYDLPKFRVQKLEKFGRQYEQLKLLYLESQTLVDQIADANLSLQNELMKMQPIFNELRDKNNELKNRHNRLIDMYGRMKIQLVESEKKVKKYRSQRNWAVAGVAVLVGSAILSLR